MSFQRTVVSNASAVKIVAVMALLLAGIELVNFFTGRSLNHLGIIPRETAALRGIVLAPFLHGSVMHFMSNIVPFALFSFLLLHHGLIRYILVSCCCILATGSLVWFFGRDAIHVGASGVIYGYFGYLVLAGILSREFKLAFISLIVGFGYGGLIFGVLPGLPHLSWESHLFGFLTGLFCAFLWGSETRTKETVAG